jgi:Glycosyl transferases group 1
MRIFIGYGYFPTTTGRYLEEKFAAEHQVTFVGTAGEGRPGYPPNVDLIDLTQRLAIQPDLFLYIDSGHSAYLPRNIEKLNCPTAAYLIDVHLGSQLRQSIAPLFDYVFIAQRDYLPAYQIASSQHVEWLPLACDPAVHKPLGLPRIYDVGFVGHVGAHDQRGQLLDVLAAHHTLNDYRRGYSREEMAVVYNQSKIAFNHAIRDDVNMRVFEAMACGALLVANRIGNGLLDLFQEGKHLVTYQTQDELVERVAYYLAHDDERQAIARTGQAEVLAHHSYRQRAEKILSVVFRQAPGARAPLRGAAEKHLLAQYAELYSKFRLLDASFDLLHLAFSEKQARMTSSIICRMSS